MVERKNQAKRSRTADPAALASGHGLTIEHRPIDKLIPYARNARTHSEAQVALIASSIREYGFTNPVLVDGEDGIIAGHGRVLAARQLGLATVPVIELAHLTPAQKQAYILADNRLALQAGWDPELLALELGELEDLGVDLTSLGFETGEIDALLRSDAPDPREEETPEAPANPVSRPGDLWRLGAHRLLCGDATSGEDVARVLGEVSPHLLVSDPPYGVNYDPGWRNRAGASETKRTGKVLNDDRADWRAAWALFPGEVAYVWHGALHATTVAESLAACGFEIRSQIVWAKERLVLSRGDYHWQHEPCWYAVTSPTGCCRRRAPATPPRRSSTSRRRPDGARPSGWSTPDRGSHRDRGRGRPAGSIPRPAAPADAGGGTPAHRGQRPFLQSRTRGSSRGRRRCGVGSRSRRRSRAPTATPASAPTTTRSRSRRRICRTVRRTCRRSPAPSGPGWRRRCTTSAS